MRVSYRELADRYARRGVRIEQLIADRDAHKETADACASQLARIAAELSATKDVVASHLVAAGHPDTVLHSVEAFRDALTQALTDAGVDIRLELARLEGSQL